MTPAGRPPRASSSSKKTITIRVTEEEKEMFTKAASPAYVSDWLRETAISTAKKVLDIHDPLPSAKPTPSTQEMFDTLIEQMLADVPAEKKAQARAVMAPLASMLQGLVNGYESRIQQLSDALQVDIDRVNKDLEIATKFAKYIKHDRECKKYPCQCSIKDIAVEVSTALFLGGNNGEIPNY
jgi:uncharacterized protein (DUF1778 family)